jgi:hypothetical protein
MTVQFHHVQHVNLRSLIVIFIYFILSSCNSNKHEVAKIEPSKLTGKNFISAGRHFVKDPRGYMASRDSFIVDFKTIEQPESKKFLQSLISCITEKGQFKAGKDRSGKIQIYRDSTQHLLISYDSLSIQFVIDIEYFLNGLQIESVYFTEKIRSRSEYHPGFVLELWTFNDNKARDSALNLIHYVYSYPGNTVMYEKSYPQIIISERSIVFLKTGADIWKKHVVEYREVIERFLTNSSK